MVRWGLVYPNRRLALLGDCDIQAETASEDAPQAPVFDEDLRRTLRYSTLEGVLRRTSDSLSMGGGPFISGLVEALGLTDSERDMVLGGNALRLLREV